MRDTMHPGQDADELNLRKALSALREGDLEAAEAIARRLLENVPDDPAVHQLAAAVALQRGETEQATYAAAASLALRPNHVPTLVIAGRAARAAEDLRGALAFFRQSTALAPDRADAAFLMCVTLLELGDAEAGTLLPLLLRRFPGDAGGWRLVGAALQRVDHPEAALVAFTRAVHATPSVALHLSRGGLLEFLGRPSEAIDAYREATAMEPDNANAILKLGLCLRRKGDEEDAATTIERAVALAPGSSDAWFAAGLVRQDKGNFGFAADAYRHALELRPDFAEAAVNLGICHQEVGDMVAAKAAYRLAMTLRPDTFGRVAQALAAAPMGEVWLDLAALRLELAG